MSFFQNRAVAWIVLVLVVALSLPVIGGGRLASMKADAENVFFHGVKGLDVMSVDQFLQKKLEAAYNLVSIAKSNGIDAASREALETASTDLSTATTVAGKVEANARVSKAVEDLYTSIDNSAKLSSKDREFANKEYKNIQSYSTNIVRETDYNERADAFNAEISGFPANLIASIRGVNPLVLFK